MPKQRSESRDTRKVLARLVREGWLVRPGKGDHVNLSRPGAADIITIDTGRKEILRPIYDRIAKIAGWE